MKNIYAMIGGVLFICLIGIICISIPTFALDDQVGIEILLVENGREKLEKNRDGYYVVDSIDEINVSFRFNDYDDDSYYRYEYYWDEVSKNTDYYGYTFKGSDHYANNINNTVDITLSNTSPITEVVINLYEIHGEITTSEGDETLVYSETVKLYFSDFDSYDLSKRSLYITEVLQGDNIIEPIIEDGKANFNIANEDVLVKLSGNNLVTDKLYHIKDYSGATYYDDSNVFNYKNTGEVINNGVYLRVPYIIISGSNNKFILNGISNSVIKYKVEDRYYDISFSNCVDSNKISDYQFNLKYKDNLDGVELEKHIDSLVDYYVNPKYHDKDKALLLDIMGSNYEDKLYDGKVTIYKDSNEVYNKEFSFNGSELNNGMTVELDNFYMELPDRIEEYFYYYIYITLDNRTYISQCIYVGDYEFSTVSYLKDGKKVFNAGSGDGTYHGSTAIHRVNYNNFNNNGMYFRTIGDGFDNLEEYEYELYYTEDWYNENLGFDIIESGKITGFKLNTVGYTKEITNFNRYNDPSYFFVIRKDDKIVCYTGINFSLTNTPLISSIELFSKDKSLYFQIKDGTYLASKNDSLRIKINGESYVDDLEYTINVADSVGLKDYKFMGKDLNEGRAMIELAGLNDPNIKEEGVSIGSMGVYVTYVDTKDLFLERTRYIVDNILDVIKGISKSTSVSDFVNNVGIVDNGSVKVFDNLGINEVTDKVGTGMLARLVDEYDNNLIDMDIVVKGDVTGDGVISITDLVKVKKHLAKVEQIEGIYELGGDITGTGNIGITDLVKMAKDVAKIEEIK